MMLYEVASVEDRGSYWYVTGVTENSFSTADSKENFLKLSHSSAKIIKDAILAEKEVRIIKPLRAVEVLPADLKIITTPEDDIKSIRDNAIKRVRVTINPELANLSGLTFYGFICLNNELADKGFFITDENRESKYLAILETGDEKLIQKLEDYLNYRDELSRTASVFKKFEIFRKSVLEQTDKDKITKLADDYLSDYYSRY
ncbi:hypothetical protein ACJVC5_06505 [Peredibacter sp. HCB2-198]|uniref:hypothetical protein n=1 Tax=Peredibacter sp. HCB2-198 TaxID=3383025 RepID=UPI0038B54A2B